MKSMHPTAFLFLRKSVKFQHCVQKPRSSLLFASFVACGRLARVLHALTVGFGCPAHGGGAPPSVSKLRTGATPANMGSCLCQALSTVSCACIFADRTSSGSSGSPGGDAPLEGGGTRNAIAGALGWHAPFSHLA